MERVQEQHKLECLRQVEKAIDNVEKSFYVSYKEAHVDKDNNHLLFEAKQELSKAWEFHLKRYF